MVQVIQGLDVLNPCQFACQLFRLMDQYGQVLGAYPMILSLEMECKEGHLIAALITINAFGCVHNERIPP